MALKKFGSIKFTDDILVTSVDLATAQVTGVLPTARGGTGTGAPVAGDLLRGAAAGNVWERLAVGTNGHALTLVAGMPTWAAVTATSIAASGVTAGTFGAGAYVFPSTLTVTGSLSANAASSSFGVNDTTAATLTVYGGGAGTDEGAELALYLSADWDTSFEYWGVDAWQDMFRIYKGGGGVVHQFRSDGTVYFAGSPVLPNAVAYKSINASASVVDLISISASNVLTLGGSGLNVAIGTGQPIFFDGTTHFHTYIQEALDNNLRFVVGGNLLMTMTAGIAISTFLTVSSSVVSTSATDGIGYATGAGGTVTQITSKATAVTLNKICGTITTHNAALAAGAEVAFVVNNNTVVASDRIIINIVSGGTAGSYLVDIAAVGVASFTVVLSNVSGGSLSQAVVLGYAVIKAVTA